MKTYIILSSPPSAASRSWPRHPFSAPSPATRTAAQRTALELGAATPHRFIRVVGHELRKSGGAGDGDVDVAMPHGSAGAGLGPGGAIHQGAIPGAAGSKARANAAKYCCLLLRTLVLLLKKDPAAILPHLPAVAEVRIALRTATCLARALLMCFCTLTCACFV